MKVTEKMESENVAVYLLGMIFSSSESKAHELMSSPVCSSSVRRHYLNLMPIFF